MPRVAESCQGQGYGQGPLRPREFLVVRRGSVFDTFGHFHILLTIFRHFPTNHLIFKQFSTCSDSLENSPNLKHWRSTQFRILSSIIGHLQDDSELWSLLIARSGLGVRARRWMWEQCCPLGVTLQICTIVTQSHSLPGFPSVFADDTCNTHASYASKTITLNSTRHNFLFHSFSSIRARGEFEGGR